jgi:hypothetical protein
MIIKSIIIKINYLEGVMQYLFLIKLTLSIVFAFFALVAVGIGI